MVSAPTTAMTHIAIRETLDGKVVDCMETVSDDKRQGLNFRVSIATRIWDAK
jgi:hypothetical protein